jgi:hypothetical protein
MGMTLKAGSKGPVLERVLSLFLLLGFGGLLALSAYLEPSSAGHGTHQQLGLAGCSFLTLTGYGCPMCGATTTFALMADLQWLKGFVNQPFAALLCLATVSGFVVSLMEAVRPRQRWSWVLKHIEPWEMWIAVGTLVTMGLAWMYKLWLMGA